MTMDKYWETGSDEMIERSFREEIDDILGDIRKNAPATRGDAIAVWRREHAEREAGNWPKWPGEEYYEEWVSFFRDLPELAVEHIYGHEVDEILKDLRTVEPTATRNDAIEEWRSESTMKAMWASDEVQRNKRDPDKVAMIAQRRAAIYAAIANKGDAGE
jgi:hypothetical protein